MNVLQIHLHVWYMQLNKIYMRYMLHAHCHGAKGLPRNQIGYSIKLFAPHNFIILLRLIYLAQRRNFIGSSQPPSKFRRILQHWAIHSRKRQPISWNSVHNCQSEKQAFLHVLCLDTPNLWWICSLANAHPIWTTIFCHTHEKNPRNPIRRMQIWSTRHRTHTDRRPRFNAPIKRSDHVKLLPLVQCAAIAPTTMNNVRYHVVYVYALIYFLSIFF